jgi:hypothetical protein
MIEKLTVRVRLLNRQSSIVNPKMVLLFSSDILSGSADQGTVCHPGALVCGAGLGRRRCVLSRQAAHEAAQT